MKQTIILTFTIILFSGCGQILHPDLTQEIDDLLSLKMIEKECKYVTLPTYKTPQKKRVPKGMSLEDAFKQCVRTNKKLRLINSKYRQVAIETNKRYK